MKLLTVSKTLNEHQKPVRAAYPPWWPMISWYLTFRFEGLRDIYSHHRAPSYQVWRKLAMRFKSSLWHTFRNFFADLTSVTLRSKIIRDTISHNITPIPSKFDGNWEKAVKEDCAIQFFAILFWSIWPMTSWYLTVLSEGLADKYSHHISPSYHIWRKLAERFRTSSQCNFSPISFANLTLPLTFRSDEVLRDTRSHHMAPSYQVWRQLVKWLRRSFVRNFTNLLPI